MPVAVKVLKAVQDDVADRIAFLLEEACVFREIAVFVLGFFFSNLFALFFNRVNC